MLFLFVFFDDVGISLFKLLFILILGSYDKSINLFDVRTQTSVLKMDHGLPVENVLIHPTGGLLISAGRRFFKCKFFHVAFLDC